MELEMASMAAAIGVSIPVLRFLLCFVATIPASFLWRLVPGTLAKHLYAGLSGAALSYLSFGFSSNLHFLIPMAVGYASMLLCRRYCGILTFFAGFGYLVGCHVYYMSGDAWKEGGIDATGALMVLTLKVISCTINYSDGLLREEGLREAQKKNRLLHCPTIIEYFGYCLCCGSHFAGPVYEMKDYLDWTEEKGIWARSKDRPSPSPYLATLRALIQAAICMAIYLYLVPQYPLSRFNEPIYYEWGFWKRLHYQYMSGFTARWKYYFIWSISEASIIISGLGFSGWSDSSPPKPQWECAKNVDILGVELATSAVQLPLVWNIQVSTWLRYYVYERLIQKGKKPGFLQLLATQTVSAIWHGLYPGYIIFFVQSALMIAGSRVIYRWQQAVSLNNAIFRKMLTLINFAYTLLVLNYSCIGFHASEAAIILLPSKITVFTLDFAGSGLSDGEHVTLGCNEKDDLRAVVNYLRTDGNVSCIGLWGRSMGAVTSLMYGAEDPSIAGMVLDSPFSNLVDLMMELVDTYKYPFPKFTVKIAIQHMRRIIKKKANFDIMDLDAIQVAKCCFVPVLLGHAIDDDFIRPHHSERIYDAYVGDKNIIKFDGDHNSPRPQFYFDSITIFFHNVLNPPEDASDEQHFGTMNDYFDQDNWHNIHEAEYRNHNFSVPLPELATRSTEDAITELRSRRPMSRTEVPSDISSQDKLFRAEENGSGFDRGPSSSRIYSSNLSNGHQHGQLIPSTNDEEFVDYSFDSLSDIPCSMEDEERMFMEAIIESLKDLEMRQSEDLPSNLGTATSMSSDAMASDAMIADSNGPSEMARTSMLGSNEDATKACTAGSNGVSEAEGSSILPSANLDSTLDPALNDQGSHIMEPTGAKNSSSSDTLSSSACTSTDGSSSMENADMAAGTRATLIVQKNPASHIMDGLAHRWGLKFFKSNR